MIETLRAQLEEERRRRVLLDEGDENLGNIINYHSIVIGTAMTRNHSKSTLVMLSRKAMST